ncbi:hypothetical protein DSCA_08050 [Desulfosarcina alkanivorans]|uniref:Uncharacterized protein n=1 Tax=Desulfosarcina alkanivorans TaxID=571177 RepID=A0A5K7YEL7_9BACT|nr:hypothetical protein [Desulfosarcina alkanivorans]BBO66875.1 hypothetical protein DSCA_08050 [Desulfosarcina alkanivorans]
MKSLGCAGLCGVEVRICVMVTMEKKSGNAGKWVQKGVKIKISNQINKKGFYRGNRKWEMKSGDFAS